MAKLIVMGDMSVNFHAQLESLPKAAGRSKVPALGMNVAGHAFHTAIVGARLGINTAVVGVLGDDIFGNLLMERLDAEGVDTTRVQIKKACSSPTNLILPGGRVLYHEGTNSDYCLSENVYRTPCSIFHLAAPEFIAGIWPRSAVEIVRQLKVAGKKVSLATAAEASNIEERTKNAQQYYHLLELIDVVITSEEEARVISGRTEWASMVRYFHERGVGVVAIKRGELGVMISHQGRIEEVPPAKVKAVETSGAGDNFAAGFLTGIIRGLEPVAAAKLGCIIAGLSLRCEGALEGTENPVLVQKAMASVFKDSGSSPMASFRSRKRPSVRLKRGSSARTGTNKPTASTTAASGAKNRRPSGAP